MPRPSAFRFAALLTLFASSVFAGSLVTGVRMKLAAEHHRGGLANQHRSLRDGPVLEL